MPAIRLLNTEGKTIGTVILDEPLTEQEIVNTVPDLRLTYSASLTDIHSFTLEILPAGGEDLSELVTHWQDTPGE